VGAIQITEYGGPDVLRLRELPDPEPGDGELLVQAAACGVNYIDTYHRCGAYPVKLPFTPRMEGAGVVRAVGGGVDGIAVGDRVAWASTTGSYSEQVLVPADRAVPVPDGVIGTVSTAEKERLAREAGAAEVIRYTEVDDLAAEVRAHTGGAGVAAVYDGVGATTFDASLAALRPRGMLALFGAASGPVPPVDPQRLNAAGSVFLTRPQLAHYTATRQELTWRAGEVYDAVREGSLQIGVGGRYPLGDAERAHEDLQARRTSGKLLLLPR